MQAQTAAEPLEQCACECTNPAMRGMKRAKRDAGARKEELPEAPWRDAWQRPRRRCHHWRRVQRSGEGGGAAWEEGRSGGNPECSCGTARQPVVRESHRGRGEMRVEGKHGNESNKYLVEGNHL